MKARVLTITALLVLCAVTQTDAQSQAVSLDSVSGLNWDGEIQIDVPVTFYIKFFNLAAYTRAVRGPAQSQLDLLPPAME